MTDPYNSKNMIKLMKTMEQLNERRQTVLLTGNQYRFQNDYQWINVISLIVKTFQNLQFRSSCSNHLERILALGVHITDPSRLQLVLNCKCKSISYLRPPDYLTTIKNSASTPMFHTKGKEISPDDPRIQLMMNTYHEKFTKHREKVQNAVHKYYSKGTLTGIDSEIHRSTLVLGDPNENLEEVSFVLFVVQEENQDYEILPKQINIMRALCIKKRIPFIIHYSEFPYRPTGFFSLF